MQKIKTKVLICLFLIFSVQPVHAGLWDSVRSSVGGAIDWIGDSVSTFGNWVSGNSGGSSSGGSYNSGGGSSISVFFPNPNAGVSKGVDEIKGIAQRNSIALTTLQSNTSTLIKQNGVITDKLNTVLAKIDNLDERAKVMEHFQKKAAEDNIWRSVATETQNDAQFLIKDKNDLAGFYKKQMSRINSARTDYEKQLRLKLLHSIAANSLNKSFGENDLALQNETSKAYEVYDKELNSFLDKNPNISDNLIKTQSKVNLLKANRDKNINLLSLIDKIKSSVSDKLKGLSSEDYNQKLNKKIKALKRKFKNNAQLENLMSDWEKTLRNPDNFINLENIEKGLIAKMSESFGNKDVNKLKELFGFSKRLTLDNIKNSSAEKETKAYIAGQNELLKDVELAIYEANIEAPCEMLLENRVAEIQDEYFRLKTDIVLNKMAWAYMDASKDDLTKGFEATFKGKYKEQPKEDKKIEEPSEKKKQEEVSSVEAAPTVEAPQASKRTKRRFSLFSKVSSLRGKINSSEKVTKEQKAIPAVDPNKGDLENAILKDFLTQINIHQASAKNKNQEQQVTHLTKSDINFLIILNKRDPKKFNIAGLAAMINSGYAKSYSAKSTDQVEKLIQDRYKEMIGLDKKFKMSLEENNCGEYYASLGIPSCFLKVKKDKKSYDELAFNLENISKYLNHTNGYINPNEDKVFANMELGQSLGNISYSNNKVSKSNTPYPKKTRATKDSENNLKDLRLAMDNKFAFKIDESTLQKKLESLIKENDPKQFIHFLKNKVTKEHYKTISSMLGSDKINFLSLNLEAKDLAWMMKTFDLNPPLKNHRHASHLVALAPPHIIYPGSSQQLNFLKHLDTLNPSLADYKTLFSHDLYKGDIHERREVQKHYITTLKTPKQIDAVINDDEFSKTLAKNIGFYSKEFMTPLQYLALMKKQPDDKTSITTTYIVQMKKKDDLLAIVRNQDLSKFLNKASLSTLLIKLSRHEFNDQEKNEIKTSLKEYYKSHNEDISHIYSGLELLGLNNIEDVVTFSEISGDKISVLPPKSYFEKTPYESFSKVFAEYDGKLVGSILENRGLASVKFTNDLLTKGNVFEIETYLASTGKSLNLSKQNIKSMSALRVSIKAQPVNGLNGYFQTNNNLLEKYATSSNISSLISTLPPISKGLNSDLLVQLLRKANKIAKTTEDKRKLKEAAFQKLDVLHTTKKKEAFYGRVFQ